MKKINLLLIVLLVAGTTMLSSCNKEEEIHKSLWSKGGEWNIESITLEQTSSNAAFNSNQTIANYGTIKFREEGSGVFTATVDGDVEIVNFTYTNTEDKLTLIVDNDSRVFNIEEWKKDSLKLSITEKYTSGGVSITHTETLNLKKK